MLEWLNTNYKLIYIDNIGACYIKLTDFINHDSDYTNYNYFTFKQLNTLYNVTKKSK